MKKLIKTLEGLQGLADGLQASGAVRTEHDAKWGSLRVAIEQSLTAANELDAAKPAPTPPGTAEFVALAKSVDDIAKIQMEHGKKLDDIKAKKL